MTVHPAALILADHMLNGNRGRHSRCACWYRDSETGWEGFDYDHPAHLAEVLDRAGLLAPTDVTTPETPTARVLAERVDRRTT